MFSLLHLSPSAAECRRHLTISVTRSAELKKRLKRKKKKKERIDVILNEDDHMAATSVSFSFDLLSLLFSCVLLRLKKIFFKMFSPNSLIQVNVCLFQLLSVLHYNYSISADSVLCSKSKIETSPLLQRGKCGRLHFLLPLRLLPD